MYAGELETFQSRNSCLSTAKNAYFGVFTVNFHENGENMGTFAGLVLKFYTPFHCNMVLPTCVYLAFCSTFRNH